MKALSEMTSIGKARLLASLFPEHIKPMTEAINAGCWYIVNNQDIIRKEWDNPTGTADHWIQIAQEVKGVFKAFGYHKEINASVFFDQLFFAFRAILAIEYILRYAGALENEKKFKLAVQLLFEDHTYHQFSLSNYSS